MPSVSDSDTLSVIPLHEMIARDSVDAFAAALYHKRPLT